MPESNHDKESQRRLEIPLNQKKVIYLVVQDLLLFFAFLAMIFIGRWMPLLLKLLLLSGGTAGALLTLVSVIQMLKKLVFYKANALIIGQNGITDHVTLVPSGSVNWQNIRDLELVRNKSVIAVMLHHPEEFLARQPWLKKLWFKWNSKQYGTPFVIQIGILQMQEVKLLELLKKTNEDGGIETGQLEFSNDQPQ